MPTPNLIFKIPLTQTCSINVKFLLENLGYEITKYCYSLLLYYGSTWALF